MVCDAMPQMSDRLVNRVSAALHAGNSYQLASGYKEVPQSMILHVPLQASAQTQLRLERKLSASRASLSNSYSERGPKAASASICNTMSRWFSP